MEKKEAVVKQILIDPAELAQVQMYFRLALVVTASVVVVGIVSTIVSFWKGR